MQLTKAIEQLTSRTKNASVRTALGELASQLGSGLLPSLLRSLAGVKRQVGASGNAGNEPEHAKYVFNIAVSVAVGVPVNKADGEAAPGKAGQPESAPVHGEGAPAVATATVHALPDASGPATSPKVTITPNVTASPKGTTRSEAKSESKPKARKPPSKGGRPATSR